MQIHMYKTASGAYVAEEEHAEALAKHTKLKPDAAGRVGFPPEAWESYRIHLAARGVELVEQTLLTPAPECERRDNHQLLLL